MKTSKKIVDSWLIASYRAGDKNAFSLLVKRWHVRLCKQAYWYTKDMDMAKDIVQDSWKAIMRKLHGLQDLDRFGSWALTIVRRKALDTLKKKTKQQEHLKYYKEGLTSDSTDRDEVMEKEKTMLKVMEAINVLPTDQKEVLTLFYIEEYSLNEISEITGVSLNTIKTRLFRAREKLKVTLKK
ncbi:RNA polymerase sigma factor [Spongiimicrobium salis]|uniref:RNA polymerase sigma factor n=1 Tax=Spongiimicrobium salis TaxID=1667022 RepID=UPI00374D3BD5